MSVVNRIRTDNLIDYFYIAKDFLWNDPVEIIPGLFLGNVTHACFFNSLKNKNIVGVVNVTDQAPNYFESEGVDYFNISIRDVNVEDIGPYLERSYHFINNIIENGDNVIVHCLFGRSRSVAVCVYYLMKRYGYSFSQSYNMIERLKPSVNINSSFIEQIKKLFPQPPTTLPAPTPMPVDFSPIHDANANRRFG